MISAQTNGFNGAIGLAATNRRKSDRIPGPFDAWRVGVLHTPVRIYDISLGGCRVFERATVHGFFLCRLLDELRFPLTRRPESSW